jgi:hypothetical protein
MRVASLKRESHLGPIRIFAIRSILQNFKFLLLPGHCCLFKLWTKLELPRSSAISYISCCGRLLLIQYFNDSIGYFMS